MMHKLLVWVAVLDTCSSAFVKGKNGGHMRAGQGIAQSSSRALIFVAVVLALCSSLFSFSRHDFSWQKRFPPAKREPQCPSPASRDRAQIHCQSHTASSRTHTSNAQHSRRRRPPLCYRSSTRAIAASIKGPIARTQLPLSFSHTHSLIFSCSHSHTATYFTSFSPLSAQSLPIPLLAPRVLVPPSPP
ncbi:hypothetical protein BCR44DRAFT_166845, partial [Catenaria anguillulae PL171]